ncbi:M23 family metallopeptidase [Geodermatophilus sp. DF01-2]|uniref:M23 family metallopeptidase n=1 Tax=Geodermatophilus sp. DF01-2 TaxID=2559610 RepID=UPI001074426C|nr:M23 family metallopeptidase [Geodermatophilus sp. DF01_2]TFV59020.1 M23 family metallopeptidase [Geodermatophilus sp. DF01_2]
MARSTGPALLERPRTDGEPAADAVPASATCTGELADAPAAEAADEQPARARRRSIPRPPGRRGPLWLAALVAGAVVAALPSTLGTGPTELSLSAADYGLGIASDVDFSGDMEDAGVRRGISEAEAQARLGELAASRAAREPKTALPTEGRMTTCFCMRWGTMHYGIDLAAPLGTPIHSATDGVVIRAGRASGYGNAVYIQDADGNVHVYGHMRYYDVEAGDLVHAGDQIAKVGNEGQSTGPHLHYQIHRGAMNGRPIDPEEFLAERGVHI